MSYAVARLPLGVSAREAQSLVQLWVENFGMNGTFLSIDRLRTNVFERFMCTAQPTVVRYDQSIMDLFVSKRVTKLSFGPPCGAEGMSVRRFREILQTNFQFTSQEVGMVMNWCEKSTSGAILCDSFLDRYVVRLPGAAPSAGGMSDAFSKQQQRGGNGYA